MLACHRDSDLLFVLNPLNLRGRWYGEGEVSHVVDVCLLRVMCFCHASVVSLMCIWCVCVALWVRFGHELVLSCRAVQHSSVPRRARALSCRVRLSRVPGWAKPCPVCRVLGRALGRGVARCGVVFCACVVWCGVVCGSSFALIRQCTSRRTGAI